MDRLARQEPSSLDAVFRVALDAHPRAKLRAALIGSGIRESRTPGMHMAEGARLGLDYSYVVIDFDEQGLPKAAAEDMVKVAAAHGLAGFNVTHPFKQSIVRQLDELSSEAAAIGAVNTVVFAEGKATGHNTDCWGFAESFRSEMKGADTARVLLLGAGGAGRAVARALQDLGAGRIDVFDVDRQRSVGLAANVNAARRGVRAAVAEDVVTAARLATGIVNTTTVGMAKYPGIPLPVDALRPDLWVADIVYFPARTALLDAAATVGSRTMAGKSMAVLQAVRAFELITCRRPDSQAMFRHFASAETATRYVPR